MPLEACWLEVTDLHVAAQGRASLEHQDAVIITSAEVIGTPACTYGFGQPRRSTGLLPRLEPSMVGLTCSSLLARRTEVPR